VACPRCGAETLNNWTLCADCIPSKEERPKNKEKISKKAIIFVIILLFLLSIAAGYILCLKNFN
jgi:uncharacterized membrane protein YvbJ